MELPTPYLCKYRSLIQNLIPALFTININCATVINTDNHRTSTVLLSSQYSNKLAKTKNPLYESQIFAKMCCAVSTVTISALWVLLRRNKDRQTEKINSWLKLPVLALSWFSDRLSFTLDQLYDCVVSCLLVQLLFYIYLSIILIFKLFLKLIMGMSAIFFNSVELVRCQHGSSLQTKWLQSI